MVFVAGLGSGFVISAIGHWQYSRFVQREIALLQERLDHHQGMDQPLLALGQEEEDQGYVSLVEVI